MTGSNFVYTANAGNPLLVGSTVVSTPVLAALSPVQALEAVNSKPSNPALPSYPGVCVDRITVDLSLTSAQVPLQVGQTQVAMGTYLGGYAKEGSVLLELSGTTAQSVDFLLTTTGPPAATAGDTVLATWNTITVINLGTANVVISPAATNPLRTEIGGTSPTFTLAPGDVFVMNSAAGQAVDSTHNSLTFTPAASTNVAVSFGGA